MNKNLGLNKIKSFKLFIGTLLSLTFLFPVAIHALTIGFPNYDKFLEINLEPTDLIQFLSQGLQAPFYSSPPLYSLIKINDNILADFAFLDKTLTVPKSESTSTDLIPFPLKETPDDVVTLYASSSKDIVDQIFGFEDVVNEVIKRLEPLQAQTFVNNYETINNFYNSTTTQQLAVTTSTGDFEYLSQDNLEKLINEMIGTYVTSVTMSSGFVFPEDFSFNHADGNSIALSSYLSINGIQLDDVGLSDQTSGASLIGVFDNFAFSNATSVQLVLKDFDTSLESVSSTLALAILNLDSVSSTLADMGLQMSYLSERITGNYEYIRNVSAETSAIREDLDALSASTSAMNLQDVTNNGNFTTNQIQFNGGTSTGDLAVQGSLNSNSVSSTYALFLVATTTDLYASIFNFGSAVGTDLVTVNATTTNLYASNLNALSGTYTNLSSENIFSNYATFTNLSVINPVYFQNMTFGNATGSALTLSSYLTINGIRLDDVGTSPTSSGAYLVGVFDQFANSNATTVQMVLEDFDGILSSVLSDITNLQIDLAAATSSIAQNTTDILNVSSTLSQTQADLANVSSTVAQNISDISNVSSTVANLETDLNSVSTTAAQNVLDISNVSSTVAQNTSDISNVSSTVAQNVSDISDLEANLASATSSIAQNTNDISNVSSTVAQNVADISNVSSTLAQTQTDLDSVSTTLSNVDLQYVTDRGALTTKAIQFAGGTSTAALYLQSFLNVTGLTTLSNLVFANATGTNLALSNSISIGGIKLSATGISNLTSGATLVGVFDEFVNSNGTTVQRVLKDFDTVIADLSNTVSNIQTDLASATSTIATLQTDLASATSSIAQNTTDISNVSSTVSQNVVDISNVSSTLAQTNVDLNSVSSTVAQNTSDISNVSSTVAQNASDISGLESDLASATSSIAQNTADISNVSSTMAQTQIDLQSVSSTVASNTTDIVNNQNSISNNASSILTNQTDISNLETDLAAATSSIAQNTTDISNVSTTLSNVDLQYVTDNGSLTTNAITFAGGTSTGALYLQSFLNVTGLTTLSNLVFGNATGTNLALTNSLSIGGIKLSATGISNLTSGATLVGVFDEFLNSNGTTVQQVLADFDGLFTTLSNQIAGVQSDLATATSTIADLQTDLASATSSIAQNTTDISNVSSTLAQTNIDLNSVSSTVAQNTSDISNVSSTVAQNVADISNVSSTVAQNISDISNVSSTVAQTNVDLNSVSSTVAQNTSDISNVSSTVAQNVSDISDLETNLASATSSIAQNTNDISNVSSTVAQNISDISNVSSTVANLETDLNSVSTTLSNVDLQYVTDRGALTTKAIQFAGGTSTGALYLQSFLNVTGLTTLSNLVFANATGTNLALSNSISIGGIKLSATGISNLTSGATLVGVFDEFTNSNGTDVQQVLKDFDIAINNFSASSSLMTLDQVTSNGSTTTNAIGFGGGTSTADFTVQGAFNSDYALFTAATSSDLYATTFNFNTAVGAEFVASDATTTNLFATNLEATNGSIANLDFDYATGTTLALSSYLTINGIQLDAVGTSNVTSGASLVGVFDEFANSNATTVQAVLADFDSWISTNANDIAYAFSELATATSTLATVVSDLGSVSSTLATYIIDLQTVSSTVAQNVIDIANLQTDLASATSSIAQNASDITVVSSTVAQNSSDIATVSSTLSNTIIDLGTVSSTLVQTNVDLNSVSSTVAQNTSDISNVSSTVAQNASDIGNVSSTVANLETDLNSVSTTLSNVDLQYVTDRGALTTKAIQFAGGTSTGALYLQSFLNVTGLTTLSNLVFANATGTNLALSNSISIGGIKLSATGISNLTSGATLVGVFDEFTNSNGTDVQQVLKDLDFAISNVSSTGGLQNFQDTTNLGNVTTNTIQFAGGTSTGDFTLTQNSTLFSGIGQSTGNNLVQVNSGTSAPTQSFGSSIFELDSEDGSKSDFNFRLSSDANGSYPANVLSRSRGTLSSPTAVQSGTNLGGFIFSAYDSNSWELAAEIRATIDGTPGDGDLPTKMSFFTAPDGSASPQERLTIKNNGNIGVGVTNPGLFKLQVAGDLGPDADLTYSLGSASNRWANVWSGNVMTTNLDAITVSTTNLLVNGVDVASSISQNTSDISVVSSTVAQNTTDIASVSTTVSNLDLQDITDNGSITTNALQFAGGTSTAGLILQSTLSVAGLSSLNSLLFEASTGTSLTLSDFLTVGGVRLDATGVNKWTSGAAIVGVFDEFTNSNATSVQGVLADLDAAIANVTSTGGGGSQDLQGVTNLGNTTTNTIQFAGGTSTGDFTVGGDLTASTVSTTELWINGKKIEVSPNIFQGTQAVAFNDSTINNWESITLNSDRKDSYYTHTDGTSAVTITATGTYRISGYVSFDMTADLGSERSSSKARLYKNNTTAISGEIFAYSRLLAVAEDTSTIPPVIVDLNAGDVIELQAAKHAGASTIVSLNSSLLIEAVTIGGQTITSGGNQDFQSVTDEGSVTTNAIQFAGGTSTGALYVQSFLNVTGLTTLSNLVFANATGTNLALTNSISIGGIKLSATGINNLTSGATLIGVFDEFVNSNGTTVQQVLADFDGLFTTLSNQIAGVQSDLATATSTIADLQTDLASVSTTVSNLDLQDITDNGFTTTNALQFAGGTSTSDLVVQGSLSVSDFIAVGGIRLDAVGTSASNSGASTIGVFDEFDNSNATTVQAALKDLDKAIFDGRMDDTLVMGAAPSRTETIWQNASLSGTGYNSVRSLIAYKGHLYAGRGDGAGDGDIEICDPTAGGNTGICDNVSDWSQSFNGSSEVVNTLYVYKGYLYAGFGSGAGDGDVYYCNPGTTGSPDICEAGDWADANFPAGSNNIRDFIEMGGYFYAANDSSSANSAMVAVCDTSLGGDANICDNAADWTNTTMSVTTYEEARSLAVFYGRLYVMPGNASNDADPILCTPSNGGNADQCDVSADWTVPYQVSSNLNTFESAAVYNGLLFLGGGYGGGDGDLWACDPQGAISDDFICDYRYDYEQHLDNTEDSIPAMFVYDSKLFLGYAGGTGEGDIAVYNAATQAISDNTATYEGTYAFAEYNGYLYAGRGSSLNDGEVWYYQTAREGSRNIAFEAGNATGSVWFDSEAYNVAGAGSENAVGAFKFSHGLITEAGAYDLAEMYPTHDETMEVGDVVAIDENWEGYMRKSTKPYDKSLAGVVSTNPGFLLSGPKDELTQPIALVGRVPVKIILENGDIKPGDPLTSASTPGYAMKATKAGTVLGQAMESFSSSTLSGSSTGTVMMFVQTGYYFGAKSDEMNLEDVISPSSTGLLMNALGSYGGSMTLLGGNVSEKYLINTPYTAESEIKMDDRDAIAISADLKPGFDTMKYLSFENEDGKATILSTDDADLYLMPEGDQIVLRPLMDSTTGIQFMSSTGDPVMNVDTENGFVGIGTDAPLAALDVRGDIIAYEIRTDKINFGEEGGPGMGVNKDNNDLEIKSATSSNIAIYLGDSEGGTDFKLLNDKGETLASYDSNGVATIAGKLGIGVENPEAALHVNSHDEENVPVMVMENKGGKFEMYRVSESPEGVVAAHPGDMAVDTVAGTMYIKESGEGTDTGWVKLATGSPLYEEMDTLASIVARGATTTEALTFGGGTSTGVFHSEAITIGSSTWDLSQDDAGALSIGDGAMKIGDDGKATIGVGDSQSRLSVFGKSDDLAKENAGLFSNFDATISGSNGQFAYGIRSKVVVRGAAGASNELAEMAALEATAINDGADVNQVVGAELGIQNLHGGHVGYGTGLLVKKIVNSPDSDIHHLSGVTIEEQYGATNRTNLLIGTSTVPTGEYSIYNVSTSTNFFAGHLGIGVVAPEVPLSVVSNGSLVAAFNRLSDDGKLIAFEQDGVEEATIAIYGNTVSYNAFTGSLYAWTEEPLESGMLVTLTGVNKMLHDDPESQVLYGVSASVIENDKDVIGAYLSVLEPKLNAGTSNPYLVMMDGKGDIWVADNGENIEVGDYLISSNIAGHAMKDTAEESVSNVIARAVEPVDWSTVDTMLKGVKHTKVSVFFERFSQNNLEHQIQNSVLGSDLQGGELDNDLPDLVVAGAQFSGKISVKGHVELSRDTVGQALLMTGDQLVHIDFEHDYETLPIITVTPVGIYENIYGVQNVSLQGFDIALKDKTYQDMLFNWHAFANNEGKVFVTNGTTMDIEVNDMGGSILEAMLLLNQPIIVEPGEDDGQDADILQQNSTSTTTNSTSTTEVVEENPDVIIITNDENQTEEKVDEAPVTDETEVTEVNEESMSTEKTVVEDTTDQQNQDSSTEEVTAPEPDTSVADDSSLPDAGSSNSDKN